MNKSDRKNIEDIIALTPLQQGMLFHYLQEPDSDVYFEQLSLELTGDINIEIFEQAWNVVVRTNEMLRTMFRWENLESPLQLVLKEHVLKPVYYDAADEHGHKREESLKEIIARDRDEKFDLRRVPFRVTLSKKEKNKYELILSNHHILYDGWSNGIILKEFFKAYHELSQGRQRQTIPGKSPFKEFIKWTQNQDKNRQEQFWRNYLADLETLTELPIKKRPGETKREEVENHWIILEKEIQDQLDVFIKKGVTPPTRSRSTGCRSSGGVISNVCQKNNVSQGISKNNRFTLAPVFYTAWGILLQKYCGSEDVIFGTTVSGRPAGIKGIEDMVGLFINTLPLRVQAAPDSKVCELLSGIENRLREREEFENTPLVEIQGYSPLTGSVSLFDTLVAIENYPLDNRLIPGQGLLSLDSYNQVETTHYDLAVGIIPFKEIGIKFSYKKELFEQDIIENLASHFKGIIRNMIENPGAALSQLEIISDAEKNRILYEINKTAAEYPVHKTLQQLFEQQAQQTPDHIAAAGEMQSAARQAQSIQRNKERCALTYRQLNHSTGRLAHCLLKKGVRADHIVAMMVEPSVEMIISILGILKSGAAYLPIDPGYPGDRVDYMLKDSGVKILLTGQEIADFYSPQALYLSEGHHLNSPASQFPGAPASLSSSLAYVIYTSGTTGWPRGVAVEHTRVVNFLHHMYNRYDREVGEADRCLGVTNIMFDVSVWECFLPLSFGAGLVVLPGQERFDVIALAGAIIREQITLIYLPPALLEDVCQRIRKQAARINLNKMLVGVEPIRDEVLEGYMQLNPVMKIINGYGPTETTICATTYNYCPHQPTGEIVPIGAPLANTRVILKDAAGHMVPRGIPGEICISGGGVARGYLNNPGLTAEKFDHEFNEKFLRGGPGGALFSKSAPPGRRRQKIYKTGDIGYWRSDGNIQFLGRRDTQVKIRGYRIELGEIEKRLSKVKGVKNAVLVVRGEESQDKYLCAYVAAAKELAIPELREHLSKALPAYMIPSYFVKMDAIPLTPNGKVDRGALPEPGLNPGKSYTAPRPGIEKKLAELWSKILGKDPGHATRLRALLGIDDDFFHLGGHSLKAAALASAIHKTFNVKIPLSRVIQLSTIRRLAEAVTGAAREPFVTIRAAEAKEYYALSPAQTRLYILQQMEETRTVYNMFQAVILEGDLCKEALEEVFRKSVKRLEILRTSFEMIGSEPVQRIHREVAFEMEYYHLPTAGYTDEKKDAVNTAGEANVPGPTCIRNAEPPGAIIRAFLRPFDLSRAPLLRVGLIKEAGKKYILLLDLHHIIMDGMSVGIFIHDFVQLYTGTRLPALKLHYKDFSQWQSKWMAAGGIKGQEQYWMNRFKDNIPRLQLPFDYERPAGQSLDYDRVIFEADRELTIKIKNFVLETGITIYMVLLATYIIMQTKYSHQEDIVVGTGVAGRTHPETEQIIGMFVNMLAIRSRPAAEKTVARFLEEVKDTVLEAFENQDYPFDELVKRLHLKREYGRNPLFDTEFTYQENETPLLEIPGLKAAPYEYERSLLKFDLSLIAYEADDKIPLILAYSPRLFKRDTIEMMAEHFIQLLEQLPVKKNVEIKELRITHRLSAAAIAFSQNDYTGFEF